jgi:hypothetical protein
VLPRAGWVLETRPHAGALRKWGMEWWSVERSKAAESSSFSSSSSKLTIGAIGHLEIEDQAGSEFRSSQAGSENESEDDDEDDSPSLGHALRELGTPGRGPTCISDVRSVAL